MGMRHKTRPRAELSTARCSVLGLLGRWKRRNQGVLTLISPRGPHWDWYPGGLRHKRGRGFFLKHCMDDLRPHW
eukprot:COSAG01_NODE_2582_length_7421_cov_4.252253_3_plen_74_part_00